MSRLPTDQTICVLQNSTSYWSEERGWTWDLHAAVEFNSVKEAFDYAASRNLDDVHVLLFRNRGVTRIDPVMLRPVE
jgi:hypothetical protein